MDTWMFTEISLTVKIAEVIYAASSLGMIERRHVESVIETLTEELRKTAYIIP